MMRISATDQILLLLQEQLHQLARDRAGRRAPAAPPRPPGPASLARVRAIAARDGITDEDVKRALVRSLLAQQLGDAVGGDPAFEGMARDVTRIIEESDAGRAMIAAAMKQLGIG